VTPFQEQGLLRQLKALRSTPLRDGFDAELQERLEQAARDDIGPVSRSVSKRGRGKLILLAAIFVPFAAAASELAWRALHPTHTSSVVAATKVGTAIMPQTPSRDARLPIGVIKEPAQEKEPAEPAAASLAIDERDTPTPPSERVIRKVETSRATQTRLTPVSAEARAAKELQPALGGAQSNALIERVTPSWNQVRDPGAKSGSVVSSGLSTSKLAPAASPTAAADNRAVERRSETRAGERHGSGSGEERNQNRERLRQGQ
jgi:hypothetical protein